MPHQVHLYPLFLSSLCIRRLHLVQRKFPRVQVFLDFLLVPIYYCLSAYDVFSTYIPTGFQTPRYFISAKRFITIQKQITEKNKVTAMSKLKSKTQTSTTPHYTNAVKKYQMHVQKRSTKNDRHFLEFKVNNFQYFAMFLHHLMISVSEKIYKYIYDPLINIKYLDFSNLQRRSRHCFIFFSVLIQKNIKFYMIIVKF